MTTSPLQQATTDTSRATVATRVPPLSHAEAGALAAVELERFLVLVAALEPADFDRPTPCTDWNVRDVLAHQAGAYYGFTSFKAYMQQWQQKGQPGRLLLDVVNEAQINARAGHSPAELIAELRTVGPLALANRQGLSPLIRALPLPLPLLGLCRIGRLTDEIYLRDTWIHRVDISLATGRPLELTAEHDGRMTALIMRDLAPRLARRLNRAPISYELTGPAGGRFRIGRGAAPAVTITIDAIDFHLLASGRISAAEAQTRSQVAGAAELATRALAASANAVVY